MLNSKGQNMINYLKDTFIKYFHKRGKILKYNPILYFSVLI